MVGMRLGRRGLHSRELVQCTKHTHKRDVCMLCVMPYAMWRAAGLHHCDEQIQEKYDGHDRI